MLNNKFELNSKNLILTNLFNFIFVSFIFLSGIRFDYFQIRILIIILIFPCIIRFLGEKSFFNIKIFLCFFIILLIHTIINIYFENSKLTLHNFSSIIFLTVIFVISYYYFDEFNKNIKNIINIFLILFFISIFISIFDYYESGDNLFCGGIKLFKILTFIDKYLPINMDLKQERIEELRFSLNEFIFNENSHLGMVAPSIIIYLIYFNLQNETSLLNKLTIFIFIFICLIKNSTTLLLGTSLSLFLITIFNYKIISTKTLKFFTLIFIACVGILIFDSECKSRFVPTYENSVTENANDLKFEVAGEVDKNYALKITQFMNVPSGNLSSAVHYHAIAIAKKSIIEKPFGWGLNRYDVAFKYFNEKNPPKIKKLNNYNKKDGTNNFVKIIVEFGIFSILFYFFIFLFLINKKIPIDLKFFYLPFIITQNLRGAGYFNSGFALIVFLMLFTYIKFYKKV